MGNTMYKWLKRTLTYPSPSTNRVDGSRERSVGSSRNLSLSSEPISTPITRSSMSAEEEKPKNPSFTLPLQPSNPPQASNIPSSSSETGKKKNKYHYIPDNFSTLDQVTAALRESGLESSNLILGIDFTKSNEWTGKVSFNNRSLHAIGDTPNPYEKAISIIGKTLAPFDEDNLIPCFGFGDATTHDQEVFSFHNDHSPCHGFEEVLACYRKIVPNLQLSGPTSYGPVVEAAIDIVEKSGGQYHVLVLIADGQVTRSVNTSDRELSPQEEQTIKAVVNASFHPLSIVLIGVGDGPWEDMRKFDDKIPSRDFDNFQFVNFTDIMSKSSTPAEKEAAFALAALMEIPIQYKAAVELGILGRTTGKARKIVPRPPPVPYSRLAAPPSWQPSNPSAPSSDDRSQVCPICLTNSKDLAFQCGHLTCRDCGSRLSNCPICRQRISNRLRVYTG
ncbi:E3 ubiquitin-protein ligase RGLG4 [Cornus florida]|uniref:E3 ubiquitin-protein ligase RGLG4 n=1 Tax=Cornus florida TaxID=4283 RepID=UPI00289E65E1|nr:E3 ubiquitin-protein ligase RGLG4 [Cornus florida]